MTQGLVDPESEQRARLEAIFSTIVTITSERYQADFQDSPQIYGGGKMQQEWQALYMMALLRQAAAIASDIGMNGTIFMGIATEQYAEADRNAPRFG